jgi:hypothetical protein
MAIDLDAPLRFLRTAFRPDDWIAILLKSHDTGGSAQRVGPVSLIANPKFQAWLRAENARRFSVFVSVNTIRPQRRARTREAISEIRHVFLDADRDGASVLTAIDARRDLPPPSYVIHSSPNRLHVLWRVSGFTKESVEAMQKLLARELGTDKAATSCAQVTRLPGFLNHKYRPGPAVTIEYETSGRRFRPSDFPAVAGAGGQVVESFPAICSRHRRPDALERARRYVAAVPPAMSGKHGDAATFRVCCRLVRGFALDDDHALLALSEWNQRCAPPWSEDELRTKLRSARVYGREPVGGLLEGAGGVGSRR